MSRPQASNLPDTINHLGEMYSVPDDVYHRNTRAIPNWTCALHHGPHGLANCRNSSSGKLLSQGRWHPLERFKFQLTQNVLTTRVSQCPYRYCSARCPDQNEAQWYWWWSFLDGIFEGSITGIVGKGAHLQEKYALYQELTPSSVDKDTQMLTSIVRLSEKLGQLHRETRRSWVKSPAVGGVVVSSLEAKQNTSRFFRLQ